MDQKCLELKHNKFSFELVEGVVKSAKIWSESHTGGGGSSALVEGHVNKVKTTVKNKIEIWIETDDGIDKCYRVDGDALQVLEGQRVRLVARVFRKDKSKTGDIVMLYNMKQKMLVTVINAQEIFYNAHPGTFMAFFSFLVIGLLMLGSALGILYFVIVAAGILYLLKSRQYYVNKMKEIERLLSGA